jgi:hypothetical protein
MYVQWLLGINRRDNQEKRGSVVSQSINPPLNVSLSPNVTPMLGPKKVAIVG